MEEKREIAPMSLEEFSSHLGDILTHNNFLRNYIIAASVFKSVNRAIKRGHISVQGYIVPKRPFNNRANTCKRKGVHSRETNEYKKLMYEQIRRAKSKDLGV